MRTTHFSLVLLAAILSTSAKAGRDAPTSQTNAPVLPDMCVTPPHWAPPFTHVYHFTNGATLVFVGVEHTQDMTDPTHAAIKTAFERYRPGLVLVEGASATKSAFDWYRKDLAGAAKQRTEAGTVSESLYAVKLASDGGVRFSGWDFSPDQDYQALVADGFALRDALGAHLLRSHIDPFGSDAGSRELGRQLRYAATIQPIASFDYPAWYQAAYGGRFDPVNGTPCGTGIGGRAIKDLSYRRNLNLIGLIDSNARPGQTLLVEAGANHWLAVKGWLRSRSTAVE